MKIATSELEHLREEVKNCHRIIKDLQKKREFVGLTDEDIAETDWHLSADREYEEWTLQEQLVVCGVKDFARAIEAKLKEKNT